MDKVWTCTVVQSILTFSLSNLASSKNVSPMFHLILKEIVHVNNDLHSVEVTATTSLKVTCKFQYIFNMNKQKLEKGLPQNCAAIHELSTNNESSGRVSCFCVLSNTIPYALMLQSF